MLSVIVISILIVTWFFPLSPLSVHKNFNYTADSDTVRHHTNKLNKLQKLYANSSPDDVTTMLLHEISPIFEQDWLIRNDSFTTNKDELATILKHMKNATKTLLNLSIEEEYSMGQRRYLVSNITNLLSMEKVIEDMMNDTWVNRKDLKNQWNNLHSGYTSSLMMITSFYEITQKK